MKIVMANGHAINRERVLVVNGDTEEFLCGLVNYDGGRFLKVICRDGKTWEEHPTEWRIFESQSEAQTFSWKIPKSAVNVAEALAEIETDR